MKNNWTGITLSLLLIFPNHPKNEAILPADLPPIHNLFVITLDGFRWQEVFNGADSLLLNSEEFTPDGTTINMLYWADSPDERRQLLMPFLWRIIGKSGQLYGSRNFENKVNVANSFAISYPGYSEIFTGGIDPGISSNRKIANPNINVFEYLNSKPGFAGDVVAFTSWDLFPYILNEKRSELLIRSGYDNDRLTFIAAKEHIKLHHPRVVYLSLGETDEAGHRNRYDQYLESANQADKMIAELWHWVQTTPGYKDETTFLITTDHGRGNGRNWGSHGKFIRGSSEAWIALLGPGIHPSGEVKLNEQIYQGQLAPTIAKLLGEEFVAANMN